MTDRLFVGVLGHQKSGKSTTWNTLFGATVRTGHFPQTLILYGGVRRNLPDQRLAGGAAGHKAVADGTILGLRLEPGAGTETIRRRLEPCRTARAHPAMQHHPRHVRLDLGQFDAVVAL